MRLIAYYRVSTKKQGQSGLGLDAQKEAVERYAAANGGTILRSYTEVESGRKTNRPELLRALADARRCKAQLVIARFDRLARNVHFLSGLMEGGVPFVAVDNPHASRLNIHILAAVAEDEARLISERTKAALAAYKARGGKLGSHLVGCHLDAAARDKGRAKGCLKQAKEAVEVYADLVPEIRIQRELGATLAGIAASLNHAGHRTRTGAMWTPTQIHRLLKRTEIAG